MVVRASIRSVALALGLALGGCAHSGFNPYREYELTDPANPEVRDAVTPGKFVIVLSGAGDPVVLQTLLADAVRESGGGVVSRITEPAADPKITARWQVEGFSGNLRALLAELLPERHIVGDDRVQISMVETQVTLSTELLTSHVPGPAATPPASGASPAAALPDLSTEEKARATIRDVLKRGDKAAFRRCVTRRILAQHEADFDAWFAVWVREANAPAPDAFKSIHLALEDGAWKLDEQ